MDALQELAVEHALAPHERDFNLDVVFGPEAAAPAVLAQCAQFPMMAERRLVIVRGFEKLEDNRLFQRLRRGAQPPRPSSMLLLQRPSPTSQHHPYRALKKHATSRRSSSTFKSTGSCHGWVEKRFRARSVETESGAAADADRARPARTCATLAIGGGQAGHLRRRPGPRHARRRLAGGGPLGGAEPVRAAGSAVAEATCRARSASPTRFWRRRATAGHGEAIRLIALLSSYVQAVEADRLSGFGRARARVGPTDRHPTVLRPRVRAASAALRTGRAPPSPRDACWPPTWSSKAAPTAMSGDDAGAARATARPLRLGPAWGETTKGRLLPQFPRGGMVLAPMSSGTADRPAVVRRVPALPRARPLSLSPPCRP